MQNNPQTSIAFSFVQNVLRFFVRTLCVSGVAAIAIAIAGRQVSFFHFLLVSRTDGQSPDTLRFVRPKDTLRSFCPAKRHPPLVLSGRTPRFVRDPSTCPFGSFTHAHAPLRFLPVRYVFPVSVLLFLFCSLCVSFSLFPTPASLPFLSCVLRGMTINLSRGKLYRYVWFSLFPTPASLPPPLCVTGMTIIYPVVSCYHSILHTRR